MMHLKSRAVQIAVAASLAPAMLGGEILATGGVERGTPIAPYGKRGPAKSTTFARSSWSAPTRPSV